MDHVEHDGSPGRVVGVAQVDGASRERSGGGVEDAAQPAVLEDARHRGVQAADLRELQDAVNDILITVQEFTADPRTDSSLGKVGR
jgi:RLL motif-containing protein 1